MDNLLMAILHCGTRDLEKIKGLIKLANLFGISEEEIVESTEEELGIINANTIIGETMRMTLNAIAEKCKKKVRDYLIEEHGIFVNLFDSWFNIETLDDLDDDAELTPQEIVKKVEQEVTKKLIIKKLRKQ